jgi:hypothetical protein
LVVQTSLASPVSVQLQNLRQLEGFAYSLE